MDNFAAMQTKAKQLVQIYKPAHNSTLASVAILVHTTSQPPAKGKTSQPKSNQHQLSPTNPPQEQMNREDGQYNEGQWGEGTDMTVVHVAGEVSEILTIDMNIQSVVEAGVNLKETSLRIEEEAKKCCFEGNKNNGMVMTQISVTETIGIGMWIIKIMVIEVGDGMVIEVKGIVTGEGEDAANLIPIINNRDTHNNPNTQTPIIIIRLQWVININIRCPMNNIRPTLNSNNHTCHNNCQHNHAKWQIYANCVRIKATLTTSANLQAICKSANFFKLKNVQVVCRPTSGRQTRQNTQITTQGTAEDQFANIAAVAQAEALIDINDILTDDDDSIDYSTQTLQPIETQVQVETPNPSPSVRSIPIQTLLMFLQTVHLTLRV